MKYSSGKRILSVLLTLILTLSLLPATAMAATEAKDLSGHWSAAAVEKCNTYGIMDGDGNGYYRPNDPITRAEFMAMVNRAFNFTETSGAAQFTDVAADAWYENDIKIASAMGYMSGVGDGKVAPMDNITREQAFTILARIYRLSGGADTKTKFSDDAQISDWARAAIRGMADAGYVQGNRGAVYPKAGITRGEMSQVLVTVFGDIADSNVNNGSYKNLTIRKEGVTLADTVINGDLFITDGVGTGDMMLDNVTVKGRTLITGGGTASIKLTGSKLGPVVIDSHHNTHLDMDKATLVERISLYSSSSISHGGVFVSYIAEYGKLTFDGEIDKITLNQNGTATVTIDGVSYDIVPQTIDGVINAIELLPGCVVKEMIIAAPVDISGLGKIEGMSVSSNGVTITGSVNVDLKSIIVDKGVQIIIDGKTYTGNGEALSGSTTGRGSSGGGTISVTGVELEPEETALAVGDTITLTASISPANASKKNVTWSTDDGEVARVSDGGVVTGLSPGIANITVTTVSGGFTATCAVYVYDEPLIDEPTPLANGTYGDSYSQTLENESGVSVTWTLDSGVLPAGLTLTPATGVISGVPEAAGTERFTVKVTNNEGIETTKDLSITITPAMLTFTADDKFMKTGAVPPEYTYTISGWKFSDELNSSSIIATPPTFLCTTVNIDEPGNYAIIKIDDAVLSENNYMAVYVSGTLTVTEKDVVSIAGVTVDNATYNGSPHCGYEGTPVTSEGTPELMYSYSGRDGTTYGPTETAPTNAGKYTVTISVNDTEYLGSISLDFIIEQKEVTITAETPSRTLIPFDGTDDLLYGTTATVSIMVDGLEDGDTTDVNLTGYGLMLSDNTAIENNTPNIATLTYDGTTVSHISVTPVITLSNSNYTVSDSSTFSVAVYDGQASNRAIPITQDNIDAFNTYARTDGLAKHYELTDDVTVSSWMAIGDNTSAFTGSFDGNGCTITGLEINTSASYQGMFGYTTGTVKNLGLEDINITGNSYVGGVAGQNGGTISNCYVIGNIAGASSTGGVAGQNQNGATVQYCYATGNVTGSTCVGGVVGYNFGTVQYCYATASVTGTNIVGGIAGIFQGTRLRGCVALNTSVETTTGTTLIGRVVGSFTSTPSSNYAKDNLTPLINNGTWEPAKTTNGKDGEDVSAGTEPGQYNSQDFWQNTMGWDFTTIWGWGSDLPALKVFSEI